MLVNLSIFFVLFRIMMSDFGLRIADSVAEEYFIKVCLFCSVVIALNVFVYFECIHFSRDVGGGKVISKHSSRFSCDNEDALLRVGILKSCNSLHAFRLCLKQEASWLYITETNFWLHLGNRIQHNASSCFK